MGNYENDFSRHDNLWGHTDILDKDLEKLEFDKNFDYQHEVFNSILDDEPNYHSLLNFPEEEEDALYTYEDEDDNADTDSTNDDDSTFNERDSYHDRNVDDAYYLI